MDRLLSTAVLRRVVGCRQFCTRRAGPRYVARDAEIRAGRPVPFLTGWRTRALTIWALYPHRPLLSPKVRTFVDFLAERFGGEPEWDEWRLVAKPPVLARK